MQRTDHRAHFKRFMLGSSPLHGTKQTVGCAELRSAIDPKRTCPHQGCFMERNGDNQGDDPSGGRVESDRELLRHGMW